MLMRILLLASFLFIGFTTFAQRQLHTEPVHLKLIGRADFYEVNSKYEFVHDTIFHVKSGFLMDLDPDPIELEGEWYYVVTYPPFKGGEPNRTPYLRQVKGRPAKTIHAPLGKKSDKFLLIKKETYDALDFEESHDLSFSKLSNFKLTYGVLTIPFKLRPKNSVSNFSLTTDSSIAPFLGVRKRIAHQKDIYLSIPFHAGISFINVENSSSDNINGASYETMPGFTFGTGAYVQVNSFMFGLSLGKDYAGSQSKTWEYQGQTWISLGLGYSFLQN